MWEGQSTLDTLGVEGYVLFISVPVCEKSICIENTLGADLSPFTFSCVINIENYKQIQTLANWWQ